MCVCGLGLGLVEWISSAAWSYPLYVIFANLPSGFATWLNVLFVVCVCRDQEDAQDELKIILIKEFMKITM
jgi:hypothetical protein